MADQQADQQADQRTDVLIVGGGVGGCAAALAVSSLGYRAVLTEPTAWIGGQLTAQAVPPDEHPWIEQFGCTRRYRSFRDGVRRYYRDHYPLLPSARSDPYLNPGGAVVSRLSHEPRVAKAVLDQLMAHAQSAGTLRLLCQRRPVAVDAGVDDTIRAVTLENLLSGERETISASYVLDATELGDLLPLAQVEYVSGAESQAETNEPHAVPGPAEPDNVQSLTWCFAMAFDAQGSHIIDRPASYEYWRDYAPALQPAWPGRLLAWQYPHPITLHTRTPVLFPEEIPPRAPSARPGSDAAHEVMALWLYRRIVCRDHYPAQAMPHEATLVNWPQNDYWGGNIIDKPQQEVQRCLDEARQLSLSLFYWLQTEAPRPDGGAGYPGLYLRPDLTGTDDGLAMSPYIRESRRIKAAFTVTELHIGAEARQGRAAAVFPDSVGIGCYRIDIHPSTSWRNYVDVSALPFQISLGALIPVRVRNLLPACKNLGVTHITNGCFRLHPVEWNIGEASGLLAAYCLAHKAGPLQVWEQPQHLAAFQNLLVKQGIELAWPAVGAV